MLYKKKKPEVVEAFQWTGDAKAVMEWRDRQEGLPATLMIVKNYVPTLYVIEGGHKFLVQLGSWLVITQHKKLDWVPEGYFENTYELMEDACQRDLKSY